MKKIILALVSILFFNYGFAQTKILSEEEFNSDSLLQQRRIEFLTPKFISQFIGASYVTRSTLEHDLQMDATAYKGGVMYYEINDIPIGLRYYKIITQGTVREICIEMSLRLFGEDAQHYENSLILAGFVLKSRKSTTNLELEGDMSSQIMNGEVRIYRLGDVVCKVIDGSYMGFAFYREKPSTQKSVHKKH